MALSGGTMTAGVVGAGVLAALAWRWVAYRSARNQVERRLYRDSMALDGASEGPRNETEIFNSWLDRWLYTSGFRSPNAVTSFLILQGLALLVALTLALLVGSSSALRIGVEWLQELPGGVGDILAPVLSLAPWGIALILGLLPLTIVRGRRRRLVESVERDFPMTLSLLATLVESGLGFDAALVRVMRSLSPERPLAVELGQFRSEAQGGLSRLVCFRRLANRLDTTSTSTFVSSMIHAEQVGGGIAESLRHQADEVWSRRRQFALQRAQTLPTKLAVPLVACFLPGIFVYTFGPALAQFFEIAEGVILNGR